MKLSKIDKKILKDYEDFCKAGHYLHIKQSEWVKMSKRTKMAMIGMLVALAKAQDHVQTKENKL